jgi:hypothetical protein
MAQQAKPAKNTLFFVGMIFLAAIAVAVVILMWAGQRILDGKGDRVTTTSDIAMLANAVELFKTRFHVYPPSRIKLSETGKYNPADAIEAESLAYLKHLWPEIDFTQGIDWNGNGMIDSPEAGGDVILEGDQCLVFFLGGIPDRSGVVANCLGFSKDPRNPAQWHGDRIMPMFEFEASRLVTIHGNRFYSYLDPHALKPFAYFSSFKKRNGYNPQGTTDCPTLGVWPYAAGLNPTQYLNPNTFQLISAGADGRFGQGTVLPDGRTWTPATADRIDADGRDDQSNFYDDLLGKRGE